MTNPFNYGGKWYEDLKPKILDALKYSYLSVGLYIIFVCAIIYLLLYTIVYILKDVIQKRKRSKKQ